MTDQIPDVADKDRRLARDWAEHIINTPEASLPMETAAARAILAAPAPQRPTLADMTPEERAACKWMQSDVEDRGVRYVIANPHDAEGDAALVDPDGEIEWFSPERVTPRPDLRRMAWPGTEKPAPAPALPDGWRLADHQRYGRVAVTNTTPNRDGYVCCVSSYDRDGTGFDWHYCRPHELTYFDGEPEADQ